MTITYVSVEEAIQAPGLRLVVVGQIPSPWSEAAKGILHVKGIPWTGVRLAYDSPALKEWAGERSAPVAIYNNEPPRSGWAAILLLAERLAPAPALLPADAGERALALGLAHEICGEQGLGWSRRLQLVEAGLRGEGGFPPKVAAYIGRKYGHTPQAGAAAPARVAQLLQMLASRLRAQQAWQPLLRRGRAHGRRHLLRHLPGAAAAAAAGGLRDGPHDPRRLRIPGSHDPRRAGQRAAGASRDDVPRAPGAALVPVSRRRVSAPRRRASR